MSKYFAAIAPRGWIWPETTRHYARDARRALGELFVRYRPKGEPVIETWEDGYAYAFKQGYRIEKVRLERINP